MVLDGASVRAASPRIRAKVGGLMPADAGSRGEARSGDAWKACATVTILVAQPHSILFMVRNIVGQQHVGLRDLQQGDPLSRIACLRCRGQAIIGFHHVISTCMHLAWGTRRIGRSFLANRKLRAIANASFALSKVITTLLRPSGARSEPSAKVGLESGSHVRREANEPGDMDHRSKLAQCIAGSAIGRGNPRELVAVCEREGGVCGIENASALMITDQKLDRALEDSFPGSDPVSISQPAPDRAPPRNSELAATVRNNPIAALLGAAMAGAVLGILLRRRYER
jgi:hypothetical protein